MYHLLLFSILIGYPSELIKKIYTENDWNFNLPIFTVKTYWSRPNGSKYAYWKYFICSQPCHIDILKHLQWEKLGWIKLKTKFFKDVKPIERSNMKCTRSKHSFFSSQISRFDTFSHENCRCLGKSKLPRDDCSCINVQLLLINNTWAGKILERRFFEFGASDTGVFNH